MRNLVTVATVVCLVALLVVVTGFPLKQVRPSGASIVAVSPTATRTPLLSSRSNLQGISMLSPAEGWATGADLGDNSHWKPLLLHFHSGTWTAAAPPQVTILPAAISMDSATDGWIGGASSQDADSSTGVMLRYDGKAWVSFPLPEGTNAITSIAALSATDVWAVDATPHGKHAHILHYTGGVWTITKTMTDAEMLQSLSMVSANEGWVAGRGSYNPGLNGTPGALWHYVNGNWQRVTPIDRTHADVEYVAMLPSGEGWGIGTYQVSQATPNQDYIPQDGVIWHYGAGRWQVVNRIVDNAGTAAPSALSAGTANDVWVGAAEDGVGYMVHCTNGGSTCGGQSVGAAQIMSIAVDSPDDGWAVGAGPQLVHCFQQRCMLTTP